MLPGGWTAVNKQLDPPSNVIDTSLQELYDQGTAGHQEVGNENAGDLKNPGETMGHREVEIENAGDLEHLPNATPQYRPP